MRLFLVSFLSGNALAQYDYFEASGESDGFIDYGIDLDYLETMAEDADAVKDYFDGADLIGARNLGAAGFGRNSNLPPGVNFEDFVQANGSFDITAFREALREALEAQDAAPAAAIQQGVQNDEERYFFTEATTTSTTTPGTTTTADLGTSCWKCDQMTYADCSAKGDLEKCEKGDKDCCFVEVRETAQSLQQLCTGCKSRNACENLRDENFHNDNRNPQRRNRNLDQCRPDYRLQRIGRRGPGQSVCRQCFKTCDPDDTTNDGGSFCFGGSHQKTFHKLIPLMLSSNKAIYPWGNYYQISADFTAMGIPIAVVDTVKDLAVYTEVANGAASTLKNVYFFDSTGSANSKSQPTTAVTSNNREKNSEMAYWALQGASEEWWRSDLKKIQNNIENVGNSVGAVGTAAYTVANFQ